MDKLMCANKVKAHVQDERTHLELLFVTCTVHVS